jgi:hypothetical protein
MRYIDEKDFICTYHKYIIENTKKLLKVCTDETEKELLDEILICAKHALRAGRRMEKRLYAYSKSIELLGFIRKKKRK